MDPFVAQLAQLCTIHLTRVKWVFVPTLAVGRTLGERLALEGINWLNLRFVMPLHRAPYGHAVPCRAWHRSIRGRPRPALMMRLLLDLPKADGYFRALADQPTMAQALWATVRELRLAGVKSRGLMATSFESPAKHVELRASLAAYEVPRRRQAWRLSDGLRRGGAASGVVSDQPQDCWTELPHATWNPLQRRLLDLMPGERIHPRALVLPGRMVPRRLASAYRAGGTFIATNPWPS